MSVSVLALVAAIGCRKPADDTTTTTPTVRDGDGEIRLVLYEPTGKPAPADDCDNPLCQALVERIDAAERSIDFAIYGMRNQSRVLAALQSAKARGVRIRGVVDRDAEGHNYYSSTDALVEAIGNVQSDQRADERLARQRARKGGGGAPQCERPPGTQGPVQCLAYDLGDSCLLAAHASHEPLSGSDAIMHDKFFVFDEAWVWTGSTNVSDSCSGGYNANLVVVLHSTALARWYTEEFEQMWKHGRYHSLKHSAGRRRVELGDAEVELLMSPQDSPIRTGVRPLLKRARKRIDIAVFFLTHKHIAEDLIEAHQRGVEVRVVIDATGARNEYSKHELLRAAGIPVKVENWGGKMHMKSAAIDDEVVIAGSMNWTSAGEYSNDENTLVIHSPALARQYEAFFAGMWQRLPDDLLTTNADPEARYSTTACSDGVDNDYDGKVDADDPGCAADPPPPPPLLPWRIVPKGERITCDVDMPGAAIRTSATPPGQIAWPPAPARTGEEIAAD